MKEINYNNLLSKSKKEILEVLGDEFNYYPSNLWCYFFKKDWLGRKMYLFLFFEEDSVKKIEIKRKMKS